MHRWTLPPDPRGRSSRCGMVWRPSCKRSQPPAVRDRPGGAAPRRLGDRRAAGRRLLRPRRRTTSAWRRRARSGLRPLAHPARLGRSDGRVARRRLAQLPARAAPLRCLLHRIQRAERPRLQDCRCRRCAGSCSSSCRGPAHWQLAEVGFLLRNGEFIPAARSRRRRSRRLARRRAAVMPACSSTAAVASKRSATSGIRSESCASGASRACASGCASRRSPVVGRPWATKAPRPVSSPSWPPARRARVTRSTSSSPPRRRCRRSQRGRRPLPRPRGKTGRFAAGAGAAFARAARERLVDLPPFDLVHLHEWMAALGFRGRPAGRRCCRSARWRRRAATGRRPMRLSLAIEDAEREAAQRGRLRADAGLAARAGRRRAGSGRGRVRAFPMEGRLPNEWEAPLDFGHVKMDIGFGPLDRLLLFVGPLEHAAGVDLLVEALPVLLQRAPQPAPGLRRHGRHARPAGAPGRPARRRPRRPPAGPRRGTAADAAAAGGRGAGAAVALPRSLRRRRGRPGPPRRSAGRHDARRAGPSGPPRGERRHHLRQPRLDGLGHGPHPRRPRPCGADGPQRPARQRRGGAGLGRRGPHLLGTVRGPVPTG